MTWESARTVAGEGGGDGGDEGSEEGELEFAAGDCGAEGHGGLSGTFAFGLGNSF